MVDPDWIRVAVCELKKGDVLLDGVGAGREVTKVTCYDGRADRDHVSIVYKPGAGRVQGLWIPHAALVRIKFRERRAVRRDS